MPKNSRSRSEQQRSRYAGHTQQVAEKAEITDGSTASSLSHQKQGVKVMHTANINKFMGMVLDELQKAEGKHPKFCDEVIPPGFDFSEDEKRWKKWNDEATTFYACDLLNEEFYEALNAYQQGDKEHALQEFAQCGAVIMRIMETIEKETESNG